MHPDWRAFIETQKGRFPAGLLRDVNDWWNIRTQYTREPKGEDRWQTPEETLALGAGDCEDYAIAKYVTLRLCGVPTQCLRLMYCLLGAERHFVLACYLGNDAPQILDNVSELVLPLSERADLFPVYEVNEQGVYVGGKKSPAPHASFSRLMVRVGLRNSPENTPATS